MPVINNLAHVRILSVDSSSSINLGNSIQINPTDNNVELGGSGGIGDYSVNAEASKNLYIDPDVISQSS